MRTICAVLASAAAVLFVAAHALAQPAPPDGAMYVALLLDSSGSMQGIQGQVQAAAQRALDFAPPAARMSVMRFSDAVQTVQGYTADREAIRAAIDDAGQPQGNTCLYDALYAALQELDAAAGPAVRKAAVLFTDGKDERLPDRLPCSVHTYDEVVARARASGIAIHAIGMYSLPENIEREELEALARETSGVSAIGNVADVGRLFAEVFAALNSTAAVPPGQGLTPGVEIRPPYSDPKRNVYIVEIAVANPQSVETVRVQIVGKGNRVDEQFLPVQGQKLLSAEVPGARLEDGVDYVVTARLLDPADDCIERPSEASRFGSQETPCIEAVKEFTAEFPSSLPKAVIEDAQADFRARKLSIFLFIEANEDRIGQVRGTIAGEAGSLPFGGDYQGSQSIQVDMPDFMFASRGGRAGAGAEYTIRLNLITPDQEVVTLEEHTLRVTPPPWYARLGYALEDNPLFPLLLGLVAFTPLLWVALRRGAQKPAFNITPPADYTDVAPVVGPPAQRGAALALHVTATPRAADRKPFIVTAFPCTVGRSPDCDVALPDDPQVSRRHLLITAQDGEFAVTDLGSNNGTWLDDRRLPPHQPVKLGDLHHLRLGERTSLEMRVQYSSSGQEQPAPLDRIPLR
jgi:hypothetical protein